MGKMIANMDMIRYYYISFHGFMIFIRLMTEFIYLFLFLSMNLCPHCGIFL